MAYEQGNLIDPKTKKKIIGNTATSAVADIARGNQPLSATLAALIERNALGYPAFTASEPWAVGAIVFNDRKLWKFTSAHTANTPWDANEVAECSIRDLLPVDVMRTASDATFVNANKEALFYMRQANENLAGLMTSAEHKKLAALPTAADLETGIIYDVSALHPTSGVAGGSTYESLSAALAVIPQDKRKGGMSVKFVLSSDNKYVQYRLMSATFNTTPTNWQGVDDEPVAESDNLVKSGGVYPLKARLDGVVIDEGTTYSEKYGTTNRTAAFYPISAGKLYKIKVDNIVNQTQSNITIRLLSSIDVYTGSIVLILHNISGTSFETEVSIPNGINNVQYLGVIQNSADANLCSFRVRLVQESLDGEYNKSISPLYGKTGLLKKSIVWFTGRISTKGKIVTDRDCMVSQPISMKAGEKLRIKTTFPNISVVSSTEQDSVAINDEVNEIKWTTGTNPECDYEYVANAAIKIVLCVCAADYFIEFSEDTYLDEKIGALSGLHTSNKDNLVNAINEVNDEVSSLNDDVTSLDGKINEIYNCLTEENNIW